MTRIPSRHTTSILSICAFIVFAAALTGCGNTTHTTAAPLPSGSTGNVSIQADATSYRTTQPIGITLHNAGKTTYYVQTSQSECTPIQMQRQVGTTWQNVMPCSSAVQPQNAAVPPGLVEPFTLAPGNATDNPNAWAPGVYRFALQLTTAANGSGAATLIYSPGVRILVPTS
jgi:hypothetical protein